MIKTTSIKFSGEKSESVVLNDKIFGLKPNEDLLYQAVVTQIANSREGNAHSKIRSEVSGGGRKPWKQKGTGNARSGSSRSPIWIGGGVTFGPRNTKNWSKKFPKKMKRASMFMALSWKVSDKKVIIVDKYDFSKIKTKYAVDFINNLPAESGSFLVVIPKNEKNIELSMRNLSFVKIATIQNLNVYDILKYDWLIFSHDSLRALNEMYFPSKTEPIAKKDNEVQISKTVKNIKNKVKPKSEKTDKNQKSVK